MKRVQIYIEDAQLKELKKLKNKTGAPISEIIRRCINKYISKCK